MFHFAFLWVLQSFVVLNSCPIAEFTRNSLFHGTFFIDSLPHIFTHHIFEQYKNAKYNLDLLFPLFEKSGPLYLCIFCWKHKFFEKKSFIKVYSSNFFFQKKNICNNCFRLIFIIQIHNQCFSFYFSKDKSWLSMSIGQSSGNNHMDLLFYFLMLHILKKTMHSQAWPNWAWAHECDLR